MLRILAAKALVRLHICTVLPEPRLLDEVISTKIGVSTVFMPNLKYGTNRWQR